MDLVDCQVETFLIILLPLLVVEQVVLGEVLLPQEQLHKTQVVVPVVLVAEWFARAARACRPDLTFAGCVDLAVLRGIELDDFDADQRFRIEVKPAATNGRGPSLELALLGVAQLEARGGVPVEIDREAARAGRGPDEHAPPRGVTAVGSGFRSHRSRRAGPSHGARS